MKRLPILAVCVLCVAFALSSAAAADKPTWKFEEKPPLTESKLQMALGVGHQMAVEEGVTTTAMVRADLYYFPNTEIAFKFGALYNGNMTGYESTIKNFGVQFGLRLQFKYRLLTPFAESAVDIRHYFGNTENGDYSLTHGGISFGAGMSVSLSKTNCIDVTVRKVYNNPYRDVVYVVSPLPQPPDDPPWVVGMGSGIGNFFDPVTVEVLYRFKL
jgi:opacity protein-like surface antigen